MIKVSNLLKRTRRKSLTVTLLTLAALSGWQYYDQGRITWHYTLLDQFQAYTEDRPGGAQPDETASIPVDRELTGRVVDVKDGDTFVLRTQEQTRYTIRLHGIDAPEWDQPYGKTASSALSRLINGREVTVRIADIDDYGRLVGQTIHEQRDINLEMVSNGHAWWYKQYAKSSVALAEAETGAREAAIGLWTDDNPVPPWVWRHRR